MVSEISTIQVLVGPEFPEKVIPLIDQAKTSIDIVVFDWRWYPQSPGNSAQLFNQAIVRAARRGVKVRAIVNSNELKGILTEQGCRVKRLLTKSLVHCKIMILDNETAITGSHNYTESAFQMNLELSVILQGREEIKRIIEFFNNLYG